MKKEKILKNAAKCLKCNDIIESKYRHHFVKCSCSSLYVDGGHEYIRRLGTITDFEELSEFEEIEE